MATQRLFVVTLGGEAAMLTAELFALWRRAGSAVDGAVVDRFCESLRDNAAALPVVYFCEWIDRWLMGDEVPGPDRVAGSRFEATCLSRSEATEWADRRGIQFQEQTWFSARLREAAAGWGSVAGRLVVVVVREVLGGSASDEEVQAALDVVPQWLADLRRRVE